MTGDWRAIVICDACMIGRDIFDTAKKLVQQEIGFSIELANGYGGYLPPRKQHELGGYETWPARSSFLEVDAESQIRSEILRLLERVATQVPS